MIVDEDVYLEHFGIKGMKWGVRNEERHAKRQVAKQKKNEANAKKWDAKAEQHKQAIAKIDTQLSSARYRKRVSLLEQRNAHEAARAKAEASAKAEREGKLTPGQKHAIKVAAVVGTALAVYGTYRMAQSGDLRRKAELGRNFVERRTGPRWSKKESLTQVKDADEIMEKVVKHINPEYGSPGTKMNCRRCTFAYEMRRRGFDVSATRTTNALGQDPSGLLNATDPNRKIIRGRMGLIAKYTTERHSGVEGPVTKLLNEGGGWGKEKIPVDTSNAHREIFKAISKQPDGARGELGVKWAIGGGHSMAWEKINGKAVIFDTQSGKKYASAAEMAKDFEGSLGISQAGITRLDNVPLNDNFLLRWLKNAN